MTRLRNLVPAVLLVASLGAAALGAAREKETNFDDRGVLPAIAKAPAKERDRKNPFEGNLEAALAGKKLFGQHCAECHGEDARGRGSAVNLRSPQVQNATPGQLVWFLRNGNLFHGMPSWSGLPDQRRWQIVTYLKTLGPHTGSETSAKVTAVAPSGSVE